LPNLRNYRSGINLRQHVKGENGEEKLTNVDKEKKRIIKAPTITPKKKKGWKRGGTILNTVRGWDKEGRCNNNSQV